MKGLTQKMITKCDQVETEPIIPVYQPCVFGYHQIDLHKIVVNVRKNLANKRTPIYLLITLVYVLVNTLCNRLFCLCVFPVLHLHVVPYVRGEKSVFMSKLTTVPTYV